MLTLDQGAVDQATASMCAAAGLPLSALEEQCYRDQVIAFILALGKNYEREQRYHGLWSEYGLADSAHHAASKAARLEMAARELDEPEQGREVAHASKVLEAASDDAIDLINYGAFSARHIHYATKRLQS